jgi:hypothetical protein
LDTRGEKLRLRNALDVAESRLALQELTSSEIKSLLAPGYGLLEAAGFWPACSRGLGILLAPSISRILRSPVDFRDSVTVGANFRVRPLLSMLGQNSIGYVLAISQDHVRLYRISHHECELLRVPSLPVSLREALHQTSVDRGAQCHSKGKSTRRKQSVVFHAQGAGHDTEKEDLRQYCRQIDKVVAEYIHSQRAPVILACVGHLAAIYQGVSRHEPLLAEFIEGSPDHLTEVQILERAWPLLRAHISLEPTKQLSRLKDAARAEWSTTDTCQIVRAAHEGHVEVLFFDDEHDLWGRCELEKGIVDVHDVAAGDDEELIEVAVRETLRHRGAVHVVQSAELPSPLPIAALLRHVPAVVSV